MDSAPPPPFTWESPRVPSLCYSHSVVCFSPVLVLNPALTAGELSYSAETHTETLFQLEKED